MTLLRRKSPRLEGYDYSTSRAYSVTICVQDRLCLFGSINGGEMKPNDAGRMVEKWWHELEHKFVDVSVDAYVVMPDHFHGILLTGSAIPTGDSSVDSRPPSLVPIIEWFKTMTTNEYIRGVRELAWPHFHGHLWQRSFYDHIVRDERDYYRARRYIEENPQRWLENQGNPRERS